MCPLPCVSKVAYGKHVLILARASKCQIICFYLSRITELQDCEGEWSRGLAPCAVTILYQPDQSGWSLSPRGAPAGFSAEFSVECRRSSGVRHQVRLHVINFYPAGHPCRAITVIRLTAAVIKHNLFYFNQPPAGLVGLVHYWPRQAHRIFKNVACPLRVRIESS